jgi:Domain of unknown function (DUF5753)
MALRTSSAASSPVNPSQMTSGLVTCQVPRAGVTELMHAPAQGPGPDPADRPRLRRSHSQLYHLAEVAEHPKTTIQVIRTGGAHAGLLAHFVIADLDDRPSMVYLETAAHGQVTDSPSVVAHVALSFDRLRAEAESWAASRDLIRKAAEERWTLPA